MIAPVQALQIDPFPVLDFSRDRLSISLFREERPSFYWANSGVPDIFFNGVNQISGPPNASVYSMRGIEYGVRVHGWIGEKIQYRVTVPFEANAFVDPQGNTQNLSKVGDVELGASYLVLGKREEGGFAGLDGWYRFPTGTNPFDLQFPILSSGKGAAVGALGLIFGEELGGFSFFQSIHYEKTDAIHVGPTNNLLGEGVFQWPDNLFAELRGEWLVFQRAHRALSLYYQAQMRASGTMQFNQSPLYYGQTLGTKTTDYLFYSRTGIVIRVDQGFSAEGSVAYFPEEFNVGYRPDAGWLFSLSLTFRPSL